MSLIKNSLEQSHFFIGQAVGEGDTVIDATAGNGRDTVFLAGLVGDNGKVYSFDIQSGAIERTRTGIISAGLDKRVVLINDGHENLKSYVNFNIKAAMFNLGYLPGGDHGIGTEGETTISAVRDMLNLLVPGGIITIVIYYGGDSGFDEKDKVLRFIETINHKEYIVMKTEFSNQPNCPPILICIEREIGKGTHPINVRGHILWG